MDDGAGRRHACPRDAPHLPLRARNHRWRAGRIAMVSIVLLSASCGDVASLSLDGASSMRDLRFDLTSDGAPARITAFRVDRCDARGSPAPESHWLTLAADTAERISRITYGTPPPGWRSVQGPQPMLPGCYRAAVANAPPLEFDVLADGRVKARRER